MIHIRDLHSKCTVTYFQRDMRKFHSVVEAEIDNKVFLLQQYIQTHLLEFAVDGLFYSMINILWICVQHLRRRSVNKSEFHIFQRNDRMFFQQAIHDNAQ